MSGIPLRSLSLPAARLRVVGLLVVAVTAVLGGVGLGGALRRAIPVEILGSVDSFSLTEANAPTTVSMSEGLPHEVVIFHGDAAFSEAEEDETDPRACGPGKRSRAADRPAVWLPQPAPQQRVACGHRRYHLRI